MSWNCPNCGAKNGDCDCTQMQLNDLSLPDDVEELRILVELRKEIRKLSEMIKELIKK